MAVASYMMSWSAAQKALGVKQITHARRIDSPFFGLFVAQGRHSNIQA
jgi:hypothetical protein